VAVNRPLSHLNDREHEEHETRNSGQDLGFQELLCTGGAILMPPSQWARAATQSSAEDTKRTSEMTGGIRTKGSTSGVGSPLARLFASHEGVVDNGGDPVDAEDENPRRRRGRRTVE
jgi:hypothetical protein